MRAGLVPVAFVLAALLTVGIAATQQADPTADMLRAAEAFLDTLSPEQQQAVITQPLSVLRHVLHHELALSPIRLHIPVRCPELVAQGGHLLDDGGEVAAVQFLIDDLPNTGIQCL